MAYCPPIRDARGYATPAALVLCVAVASVAAAMTGRALGELRLAHADLRRMQAEYDLDGAQLAAGAGVVRSRVPGPYLWTFATDNGWVETLAEPEVKKIGPATAAALSDAELSAFGVADAAALRARLQAQRVAAEPVAVAALDPAPLWQACAPSIVSPYGGADHVNYIAPQAPGPGPDPQSWRIGETWRIRVTTSAGWRDDRIVRFTGDAHHPVAVVSRQLTRPAGESTPCPSLLSAMSAS